MSRRTPAYGASMVGHTQGVIIDSLFRHVGHTNGDIDSFFREEVPRLMAALALEQS